MQDPTQNEFDLGPGKYDERLSGLSPHLGKLQIGAMAQPEGRRSPGRISFETRPAKFDNAGRIFEIG